MSNKVSLTAALLLISASILPQVVQAASATALIPVSANVTQACSISTVNAIAFGPYDSLTINRTAALNATGTVSVSCSRGSTGLTIGMDNGTHNLAAQRQMLGAASPTNLLQYNIFQPPSSTPGTACQFPGTTAWGTTTTTTLVVGTPTSIAPRNFNVCGTVPAAQDVPVDTYTDVVTATINF